MNLRFDKLKLETVLSWEAPKTNDKMQEAVRYVVYGFKEGDTVNLNDAKAIIAITNKTSITLPKPFSPGNRKKAKPLGMNYVVTALDRCNNESPASQVTVRF